MSREALGVYRRSYVSNLRAQLQAANERAEKAAIAHGGDLALMRDLEQQVADVHTKLAASEQTNAALKAEVERLTKECVAYRNGSGGFISSPSLHTTTSDVPESFKRGMEEIENGEVTPMFRQSAIDELNDVAEALSGEPEIARLKAERDAARALNDTLAAFVLRVSQQKPSRPDYWNSCGQCENNSEDAKDLISAYAKAKEAQP